MFKPNFIFFWIFLDLLHSVSVNIHVIKIITRHLADVWYINFSSDPTNKFLVHVCEGIGIGYKSMVKLEFCAQPMHQIYFIIASFFKLVYQKHCVYTTNFPFPWLIIL